MPGALIRLVAFAGAILCGAAPTSAAPSNLPPAAKVARFGNEISISGFVEPSTLQAVKRELSSPDGATIDTLVVESTGAEHDTILELGRVVRARKLTLKVKTLCGAPCAKFQIPAAVRVVVQRPSMIIIGRVMRPPPPKLPDFIRRGMQHVIDQQNEYWRELKVNPESFYALAEFMDLMDSILASQGKTEKPQIVPDEAYVRQCLGPHVVEMPEYTIADSTKLAHINKDDPLAFLIAGKIFYEGKRLPLPELRC